MNWMPMIESCAPDVHPVTMAAVVTVESNGNPYAIGVVGGRLVRQPRNLAEAVATAIALHRDGMNYSLGLAQINRYQFDRHGLDIEQAFEPCTNLRAGARILQGCYEDALRRAPAQPGAAVPADAAQRALAHALSCYYSGNPTRGLRPDPGMTTSYVDRVRSAAARLASGAKR